MLGFGFYRVDDEVFVWFNRVCFGFSFGGGWRFGSGLMVLVDGRGCRMDFSVVIPMHNAERWIVEALISVSRQTVAPREVIVVADACSDRSVERVKQSGVAVHLIEIQLNSAAAARNVGIHAASGDAIALLDADDYWLEHHLESARDLLSSGADVAYMSGYNRILPTGEVLDPTVVPLKKPTSGLSPSAFIELLDAGMLFGHLTIVYRRDALLRLDHLYDDSMPNRHDFDLWLRVIADRSWCCDPGPTATYRVDVPGVVSGDLANGHFYGLKAMVKNRKAYPGKTFETMLQTEARRAMSTGLVNGTDEQYRRAKRFAVPHLHWRDRLLFGCLGQRGGILSRAIHYNRMRRFPQYYSERAV